MWREEVEGNGFDDVHIRSMRKWLGMAGLQHPFTLKLEEKKT
jgi:hypothetical protein